MCARCLSTEWRDGCGRGAGEEDDPSLLAASNNASTVIASGRSESKEDDIEKQGESTSLKQAQEDTAMHVTILEA